MPINKSSVYGKYGGVTRNNFYTPPPTVPYSPASPPIVFRQEDKDYIEAFREQATFIGQNAYNVLVRTNTESILNGGDNIDTFVITTSAKPEDRLLYTSNTNNVTINTTRITGGIT